MIVHDPKSKGVLYLLSIVLVSILLIEGSSLCLAQNVIWTVTENPSGSHDEAGAICSDDNYIYVAKQDCIPGEDYPSAITSDGSYIYLAGYDSSPGYPQWRIQKRNKSDGSEVWTKTDIPVASIAYDITCDDTYIYAVGSDRSPGDEQWRIEKRKKSDGAVVWSEFYNPSSYWEGAHHITSDDSYIYITGSYYVGFANTQCIIQKRNKSDGFLVWEVTENPSDYYDSCGDIVCDDTYLYTAGHDSALGGRWDDQWRIQKWYKSDGSLVWTHTEDLSSSYDTPYAITSDDNYIYVVGRDSSPGHFNFQWRIQKRNKSDGSVVWTETENPSSGEDFPSDITSDGTYIYIAGADSSQGYRQWRIQKRHKGWTLLDGELNIPRQGLTGEALNGYVYAIGGDNTANPYGSNTVSKYDPSTDSWTLDNSMPTARHSLSSAVIDGWIYAVCGHVTNSRGENERFNGTTWESRTSVYARSGSGDAAFCGKLYVFGGLHYGTDLSRFDIYNPTTDTWSSSPPVLSLQPLTRYMFSLAM